MALSDLTDPDAVVKAIQEHDELGRDQFLAKYRFGAAVRWMLVYEGREYDSKAIVGAAHGFQLPDRGPLKAEEFTGGEHGGAVSKLRQLGFEVRNLDDRKAWIFQGNPTYYDIAQAVKELRELSWVVRRHRAEVEPGDRVYLWQSGPSAGILATATVISELAVEGPDAETAARFYLKAEEFSEPEPRVRLRIDTVLPRVLSKDELRQHGLLRELSVVRAPTGTNFRVTPEQDALLSELVAAAGDASGGDPVEAKWQEAVRICSRILANRDSFEEGEVLFKHEVAADIPAAFEAARAGGPLTEPMKRAFRRGGELLHYIAISRFRQWVSEDEEAARAALVDLEREGPIADRIDAFLSHVPEEVLKGPGARISFASYFLLGLDLRRYPVYRPEPIKGAERLLGWPAVSEGSSLGQEYEHHVAFVERFRDRMQEAGLDVRDVLDAQSLIWMLMKWGDPEYRAWRGEETTPPDDPIDPTPPEPEIQALSLTDLAESLFVDERFLREVLQLLESKRQLIFYGPPGTGKTYIARALARHVARGKSERLEVVQFHPSYSYEDFIQGYRPRAGGTGQLHYELVDGPLLRLAHRAREAPDETFVLLIDEINRGNLPRIFGELLYLLEYRDDEIALMYGADGTRFSLPSNLWVLGTMNTADRSIGLIDAALRRRFHFKALFPGRPPLDGLLERWLARNRPNMTEVAEYVALLNRELNDRFGEHLQVGHSYFMVDDLTEQRLEQVWAVDILPFLEDQLFGKEEELARFTLASIRRRLTQPQDDLDPGEGNDADHPADGVRDLD